MRIEICGGIGSGKTTLANLLNNSFGNAIFENFRINPFWKPFYSAPEKYNFETEITFLLQHYHEIKVAKALGNSMVCDFSFYQDLAYANMGLSGNRLSLFKEVWKETLSEVGYPDLIVYLNCDEHTLLSRVKNRGRKEESAITTQYLQILNDCILDMVHSNEEAIKVITINSKLMDFATNNSDQIKVLDIISNSIV